MSFLSLLERDLDFFFSLRLWLLERDLLLRWLFLSLTSFFRLRDLLSFLDRSFLSEERRFLSRERVRERRFRSRERERDRFFLERDRERGRGDGFDVGEETAVETDASEETGVSAESWRPNAIAR